MNPSSAKTTKNPVSHLVVVQTFPVCGRLVLNGSRFYNIHRTRLHRAVITFFDVGVIVVAGDQQDRVSVSPVRENSSGRDFTAVVNRQIVSDCNRRSGRYKTL